MAPWISSAFGEARIVPAANRWNGSGLLAVVTGDILRRFGNYICRLAEVKIASVEADAAKRPGHPPH